jgi:hypothetical protein
MDGERPGNVAIAIDLVSGDVGLSGEITSREEVIVAGRPAERIEQVGVAGAILPKGARMYQYVVALDEASPEDGGVTLVATVLDHPDFQDNVSVLHRMMESLSLDNG